MCLDADLKFKDNKPIWVFSSHTKEDAAAACTGISPSAAMTTVLGASTETSPYKTPIDRNKCRNSGGAAGETGEA